MMTILPRKYPLLALTCLLLVPLAVRAQVVSVNWKEFAGAVNDPPDGYGVVPATNWYNLQQTISGTDLVASDGSATTIDLSGSTPGYDTFNFSTLDNTPMRAGLSTFTISPFFRYIYKVAISQRRVIE